MSLIDEYNRNYVRSDKSSKWRPTDLSGKVSQWICSPRCKGIITLIVFSIVVPLLLYYFIINKGVYKKTDSSTCLIKYSYRVPCGRANISETLCVKLDCCFDKDTKKCYHPVPAKYSFDWDEKAKGYFTSKDKTPFGTNSIKELKITVRELSAESVSIKLHEAGEKQEQEQEIEERFLNEKSFNVTQVQAKLMVEVNRHPDNELILTTSKGALIASQDYWEWNVFLTHELLFGLGHSVIRLSENDTLTKVIYKNEQDHSVQPIIWAYNSGKFHSLTIKHEGPLEIAVLASNLIILRAISGRPIELILHVGPTPADLHRQLNMAVSLPPFWLLEPHICMNDETADIESFLEKYDPQPIFRSTCIHNNLFTYLMSNGSTTHIPAILDKIQKAGMKILLSLPPQIYSSKSNILYNVSIDLDAVYRTSKGDLYNGTYLKNCVVYPDYSKLNADQSAVDAFVGSIIELLDGAFGNDNLHRINGFVFTDNWPANEAYKPGDYSFTYLSEDLYKALSNTLPWELKSSLNSTLHLLAHNNYAKEQILTFAKYLNNSEYILLSAAASSAVRNPPLVVENVALGWANLKLHINDILFNSIIGNHLLAVPVCGSTAAFDFQLQERTCLRWYLAAATMPLLHVSSVKPYRDPDSLAANFTTFQAERFIKIRSKLLPFYYTMLASGKPLLRPMFYDYYTDNETLILDEQYMVGDQMLVAHPFTSGAAVLKIYLPPSKGIWYELWGGESYNASKSSWIQFNIIPTDWISFVPQGYIIPFKDLSASPTELELIIAQNCSAATDDDNVAVEGDLCAARGQILIDEDKGLVENNLLTFNALNYTVTVSNIVKAAEPYVLKKVSFYRPHSVTVCRINEALAKRVDSNKEAKWTINNPDTCDLD